MTASRLCHEVLIVLIASAKLSSIINIISIIVIILWLQ